MLRNFYIALVIVASLFVGIQATPASALSAEDLQAQITRLMQQITELTSQLNFLRSQVSQSAPEPRDVNGYPHRICGILARNLAQGSQGDDVRGLQEYLNEQGYLPATATGYYGPMTAQAVAKWQSSEGVSAVGSFGPMSRERLRVWCGGSGNFRATPTRGDAPLAVTFYSMVGGYRPNTISYSIDYGDGSTERAAECSAPADACTSPGVNAHTYTQNGTYMATLNKITDPCGGNTMCRAAIHQEVIGKVQIVVGSQTASCRPINYMPPSCADGSAPQAQHNESGCVIGYECPRENFTPPANCKAWNDGCNVCSRSSPSANPMCSQRACFAAGKGYCTTYFDDQSGNRPPVISGFSGPTTLNVNQTGTWTLNASDPENQQLSYYVTWGDEYYSLPGNSASARDVAFTQTTTFTHAYSSGGTFTVTILVRDSAGREARTTATVRVSGGTSCTADYTPVCGKPSMCYANVGAWPMECEYGKTYSNRCVMNSEGATFLHDGSCQSTIACPADAMQCPNGQWVGRTGPNCQFVCPN